MPFYPKRPRRRRSKATELAEEMRSVLKKLSAGTPSIHPEIWARWGDIAGEALAKRTIPRALKGKTLILAVASSAWMNELMFLRQTIVNRLAEEVGPNVVKEIRLVLDPLMRRPSMPPPPPPPPPPSTGPLPRHISEAADRVTDSELRETILRAAKANIPSE